MMKSSDVEMYDTIIVGGSIAGSTTAYRLKSKGHSVLVIDKERFPRDKPCGDGMTEAMIKELPYKIPRNLISNKISNVGIVNNDDEIINFDIEKGNIYTSPRLIFDDFLLRKAKKIGVDVLEGTRVLDIKKHREGYQIISTSGSYSGKTVIGADGFSSIVNKKINIQPSLHHKKSQYRVAIRGYLEDKSILKNNKSMEFYMDKSLTYGYGWLFPSKNGINIGIGGIPNGKNMKQILYQFCNRVYNSRGKEFDAEKLTNIKGHHIPLAGFTNNFAKDNVLLIGDAARLVDPFSGEGMRWAVISGKIAAKVIDEKLDKAQSLEKYYNKQIRNNIHKNLRIGMRASNYLYYNFDRFFSLMQHNPIFGKVFARIIVGEIDYRLMLKNLPRIAPKLVYNGIKAKFIKQKPRKNYINTNVKSFYKNMQYPNPT